MGLGDRLLPILDRIRGIPALPAMALRHTSVSVHQRTWSGGQVDKGTRSDLAPTVPATTQYLLRAVSQREVAQSGGRLEMGDVRWGPITPKFPASAIGPAGGFSVDQLDPPVPSFGVENVYTLTDTTGRGTGYDGEYRMVNLERDYRMHFILILRRLNTTP